jgi:hypothetical protein
MSPSSTHSADLPFRDGATLAEGKFILWLVRGCQIGYKTMQVKQPAHEPLQSRHGTDEVPSLDG